MDESVNNIYFLKETISKFKNEIQKFITDPQYANNNAVNIRHSLEDLEKTIINKEKNIAGQILNNNNLSYKPILSKYSAVNLLNNSGNNDSNNLNSYGFKSNKPYFSQQVLLNNLSKSDFLGNTSVSQKNNNDHLIKNSIYNFNNIYNNASNNDINNNNIINNSNLYLQQQQGLNEISSHKQLPQRSLVGGLSGISNYSLSTANNLNNNYEGNNNRNEIQPELKNVAENYYDLTYLAKRIAKNSENLAAAAAAENKLLISNNFNINNTLASHAEHIEKTFLQQLNSRKQLSEEKEKAYFKSTLMLRRINDEIHEKIKAAEKNFKENKTQQQLMDKYDIARKKLNKIKVKRSAGNINYMDRKKIQKFAFDKRSFFNSVNLDKNQMPIITIDEIERGLLAMINRGVIPKQADLTPAFNRDGHPISLAAGEALREIYGKNNFKDEIEFENNKSLERVKINIVDKNNKAAAFFLTAAAANNETKNAVVTVMPKISLFNNVSRKNHKICDEEIAQKDKVKELSEFEDTRKERFIDNPNKSQESIEKYNAHEKMKMQNNDNFNNNELKLNSNENENNHCDLNGISISSENKNSYAAEEEENLLLKIRKSDEMRDNNCNNNKYSTSYYQTESILHSKIRLTKNNFAKEKDKNKNNKNFNSLNFDNICLTQENKRYENKYLNELSPKNEKQNIYTENNQNIINNTEDKSDSNRMENELEKQSFNYNISETYTNTDRLLILNFKNFCLVQNQDYNFFKNENEENWGKINYLINYIQKLFKKLNFVNEEIDTSKLLNLAKDELTNITNKDLILLMTDRLLKQRGFANKKVLHLNLKEAFIVRIQNYFRMYSAKKNILKHKSFVKKVIRIQRLFRLFVLKKIYNVLIEDKKKERLINYRNLMDNFKENWKKIKKESRIEIHINSYAFNNLKNSTFEKFNERQNNQLNRMTNLKDPNVEIIYVCPFEIGNEVLSYYFSILSTMGVENAKERFHLLVPVSFFLENISFLIFNF